MSEVINPESFETTQEAAKALLGLVVNHLEAFEMRDWFRVGDSTVLKDGFTLKLENITDGHQKCGTTLCLAGFAGIAMGETIHFQWDEHDEYNRGERISDEQNTYFDEYVDAVQSEAWSELGNKFLQLKYGLGSELFYTSNAKALAMLMDLARGVDERTVLRSFYSDYYSKFEYMELSELTDGHEYL